MQRIQGSYILFKKKKYFNFKKKCYKDDIGKVGMRNSISLSIVKIKRNTFKPYRSTCMNRKSLNKSRSKFYIIKQVRYGGLWQKYQIQEN